MGRDVTAAFLAALDEETLRPFYLFEAEFSGGTVHYWSGDYDLTWNSQSWVGNGVFLGLSSVAESQKIEADGVDIILSSAPAAVVALALSSRRTNKLGTLYLGLFDASGAIIADPAPLYVGGLNSVTLKDDENQTLLVLGYESALLFLNDAPDYRYSDQQQKLWYPGDLGFSELLSAKEWSGYWGLEDERR